jgi:hypothetical protein
MPTLPHMRTAIRLSRTSATFILRIENSLCLGRQRRTSFLFRFRQANEAPVRGAFAPLKHAAASASGGQEWPNWN